MDTTSRAVRQGDKVRDKRTGKPGTATMSIAGRVRVLWVTGGVQWVAADELAPDSRAAN